MPGLFNKEDFKDNCGFGLVANINGVKSHKVITNSIDSLVSMTHRGGVGSDGKTGDGCGLLFDIDHNYFKNIVLDENKIDLGEYFAVAQVFYESNILNILPSIEDILNKEGLELIFCRNVPVNRDILGEIALDCAPNIYQLFIKPDEKDFNKEKFDTSLLQARKFIEEIHMNDEVLYICSMSSKTIVYKGLMLPNAIKDFYLDLGNDNFKASTCVFHQRFSTNTSPRWHLAQPFRLLAHNGEINAIRGNRNWVKARSSKFLTPLIPKIQKFKQLVNETGSDSSSLDNMIELLVKGGVDLFRAVRMVLPPAWQNTQTLDPDIRSFHEYNSMHMEPWDGPAGIVMADGQWAVCILDRNGLRPARYQLDNRNIITIASETGVNPVAEDNVVKKGRVEPGGILAVNTLTGEILNQNSIDNELKEKLPYRKWLKQNALYIESRLDSYEGPGLKSIDSNSFMTASKLFLLFKEERSSVIKPLAVDSQEGTGSMGDDTALAVMSKMHRQIYDFFRQQFAQVTNPPIDSLREVAVMTLETCFGPELNIYEESPEHAKRLVTTSPVLSHRKLQSILSNPYFKAQEINLSFEKNISLKEAIINLQNKVVDVVDSGTAIIHLVEDLPDEGKLNINALLAVGAVHQKLVKLGKRSDANIIVTSYSARDTHQIACLIGFGATAVYPSLAYQTILDLTNRNELKGDPHENCFRYRKGINKGLLKIISKMGISTISSYRGSQLFEIVGLGEDIVDLCFTNTTSRVKGRNFKDLDKEIRALDDYARSNLSDMNVGGLLKYIHGGEYHAYNPEIVKKLQEAVNSGLPKTYKEYSQLVDSRPPAMLRDLLAVNTKKKKINLSKVESQKKILNRFDSAGMSLGALSPKAHETLAEAMNTLGGRSNSGEGGEAVERYGTIKRSKIKQIASGRFGVTPHYLVNAEVLQIKIAQGAKPGEGGQLPGGKVNQLIAKLRYSTPGVTLISPPPHHDIYSIEDLAQLIYDLKEVNPSALVSVKLVSEPGVGTIASGVAKAYADLITISGHDGGTGASPLTSIRYAGSPWELGLAEAHQSLRDSGLRHKVRLQADGGMKTGLDVIKAAILGAESFGFGTGPMIAMGCKYLRICHLNNCATGVATQRDDLINHHFVGEKEKVMNYFKFIADDVREHLSIMGISKLEDIIGQTQYLEKVKDLELQFNSIDLKDLLYKDDNLDESFFCKSRKNNPWDKGLLVRKILKKVKPAIDKNESISLDYKISNTDRSVGALISGYVAAKFGESGLKNPININFSGSAGQSFGCWNANGINLVIEGDANDYVGKGMNGGNIVIKNNSNYATTNSDTSLVGNTCLYGATGGNLYVSGRAGERFAVRNSGANAVIEGAGDHCCEYMTGGQVTVLGSVGANFGAGMTGGFAYVLDEERTFFDNCNRGLVNIERITTEDMQSHRKYLKEIIANHYKKTNSVKAKMLMEDFERYEPYFWLVVPAASNIQDLLKATTANAA
ncbi:MAG: glutamate synthase large subunit [Gammaproteobacteria bacterium]|uniref:Glutamate synthase large subunit n=1 Tax=SAR86 cluster bacterium TaxID=2030880 RepID=A0A520MGP5_9GAMM|nr:MAG: glutamate synthase large subunit [SAR86 cluster bacterium]|tara:strand:+ start:519 stop:4952 length:4434 start_codon:yes stop_codon:yes gene_type:complete